MALRGKDEREKHFIEICMAICKYAYERLYDLYICDR